VSREITLDRKLEVVKLYFEGFSYDDIAEKTGVAKGSVAAVVEALRVGEFPQFEQVTDLVNELRELTVGLRKAGITIIEATPLFILLKKIIGLGVEPAYLESWIRMCRAVPEEEFSRSQIIQAASKLSKLEKEGLSYEQTLESLRTSSAELERLRVELAELRDEETKLHGRREELTQANHRLEAESVRLQGRLNAMAVKEKEQEDRLQELGEQVKQCQEEMAQLETEKSKLKEETSQLQERMMTLEKQVADKTETLRGLDEIGFPRDQLNRLRDRLSEIAQRHGTGEAVNRFFGYLETYKALIGMEATKGKLTEEVKSLTGERESLARLAQKLELTSEQITEGIAAIKSLRRKGVSPTMIVSYERMLAAAGFTPESFEKVVADFSSAEKALTARRAELDRVAQELEEKGQALRELQGEVAKVRQSITSLRDSGVKQINSVRSSAVAEVKKLCRGLHDDIRKWGDTQAEMGKLEEELKFTRYFVKLPLSEEAISSLVADLSLQVVVQYLMIGLAWCRKNLNPKLRPPREITKKYYSIGEYTEVELADIFIWALLMLVGEVSSDKGRI
jgi:DNA repair exonuclease SbcCD ATPase subunit